VRYHAVLALERLGDPRAVGPLVAVLDDEEIHLQKRVLAALKTLTGRDDNDPDSWRTWWKQKEKRD
jgi:HEAT repeat protein